MRACWLLVLVCSSGCDGGALTEAVVSTDTDLSVPDDIDEIVWEVDATTIGGQRHTARVALSAARRLPVVLPIVHDGGPLGPVVVTARGLRGGGEVVSRSLRFTFVPHRSIYLSLDLSRACVGVTCGVERTCVEGRCEDRGVVADAGAPADAGPVPRDAGELGDAATPLDGGAPDAGTVMPDAGPPVCLEGCACEQSCVTTGCECNESCGCTLSCVGDGITCHDSRCEGEGTQCSVVARDAEAFKAKCEHRAECAMDLARVSRMTVECKSGARCDVTCTDVDRCDVSCDDHASCALVCDASPLCRFTACEVPVVACPDGTLVCNRACP